MRANVRKETVDRRLADGSRLTDDDCVVVSDEHLAVDVDELRHQATLQLRVGPQAGEGDVVHPLVVHWGKECCRQGHIVSKEVYNTFITKFAKCQHQQVR